MRQSKIKITKEKGGLQHLLSTRFDYWNYSYSQKEHISNFSQWRNKLDEQASQISLQKDIERLQILDWKTPTKN